MTSFGQLEGCELLEALVQGLDKGGLRIVDLTWKVYPGMEERTLKAHHITFPFTDKIMGEFTMHTHISTHVESRLHIGLEEGGPDVTGIPLETLIGSSVYLEIKELEQGQMIGVKDLPHQPEIRAGDIVLVGTDNRYSQRPTFLPEIAHYFVDKGAKAVGLDMGLAVDPPARTHEPSKRYCHDILLKEKAIPIIEELSGLDQLKHRRFFFVGVPLAIAGLDSCPIRAFAIEPTR